MLHPSQDQRPEAWMEGVASRKEEGNGWHLLPLHCPPSLSFTVSDLAAVVKYSRIIAKVACL